MTSTISAIRPRLAAATPSSVRARRGTSLPAHRMTHLEIEAQLLQRIVGQDYAVRQVSIQLAVHLARRDSPEVLDRTPNLMLIGDTGCGKTALIREVCRIIGCPFAVVDSPGQVTAGIVGSQPEDCIAALVASADEILQSLGGRREEGDAERLAESGVIFLDEFDKLSFLGESAVSDYHFRGVQRSLLALTSGARMKTEVKHHQHERPERWIDTSSILFVAAGTFVDFGRRALTGPPSTSASASGEPRVTSSDLNGGFLPELVGRFPVLVELSSLTADSLARIVRLPAGSPLGIWRHYFRSAFNAELEIDDSALHVVTERAAATGLGARGIPQALHPVLSRKVAEIERSSEPRRVTVTLADVMPAVHTHPAGPKH
jgi:ATP-dependent Clp protease ATP-binding subunit ClpX